MNSARLLASNEWRLMRRSRVAQLAVLMLLALTAIATLTSLAHRDNSDALRARFQAQADREFDGQPARHPHRMVHYGHFVFRPLPALAAFDPGVDAFTGSTIFLEGHRQNSANFGDVRQSSLLARFGQLTPAFVLQVLAPLVLVFIGFGLIAREREAGTLRVLAAHGMTVRSLIAGKALALGGLAMVMLLPVVFALAWLVLAKGAPLAAAAVLALGYAAYLALWVIGIAAVSSLASNARTSLMSLLGIWAVTTILIPRAVPDIALAAAPLPTRLETDIAIQRDQRRIGDSHNPDDPHFAAFKARILKQYGVSRVEDLPVNYRGLLAMEGEKLTLLGVMAHSERGLWARRIMLRTSLLFAALALPFAAGAVLSGAGLMAIPVLGAAALYFVFWAVICILAGRAKLGSVANAATLAACWLILTLVLPALALLAINSGIPVRQGVELTLAQREAVHAGWDKPKEATMRAFFRHHPEWRDTAPVEGGFHWKWYYAFQHLGDLRVSSQARAYQAGLQARDLWTRRLGYVLPAVGAQVAIHWLAETDLAAQLAYSGRIRAFHERLRRFYYPYIFNDRPFRRDDFDRAPRWVDRVGGAARSQWPKA